ncbi:general substrate transporter [Pilobolus umbonatus]|nr:general substrate transporter [Pilobolus umbonatus]
MDSLHIKRPAFMIYSVLVACLGSFSNGWVIGSPNVPGKVTHACLNGSAYAYSKYFPDCLPMDDALWGFAVASFCVGGLVGGLTGGALQTKFGRKKTILFNNLGFIFGGMLIGCAVNTSMFVIGRILCGVACGLGSLTIPTYIGEVSTIGDRGAMGTCNQFFIVIGILLSSVIGLPLANVPLWRLNYAIVAVPAIIQMLLMASCVESPRYLISIDRIEEARKSLIKLRSGASVDNEFFNMVEGHFGTLAAQALTNYFPASTEEELADKEVDEEDNTTLPVPPTDVPVSRQQRDNMGVIQIFKDPVIRRITATVVGLHAFQQLVGINAVMYYSTTIFNLAFDAEFSKYMTIVASVVNFVTTAIAVAIIDKMGRRPLLLIANAGAAIFCVLLVLGYVYNVPILLVVSVFCYVASFAIGIGPIPWLMTSEITPTYASSSVGAVATSVNWAMNFIIGQCFPVIFARLAGYSFIIFAMIAVMAFVFTLVFLPETKGRSLEEIVQGFENLVVIK